MSRTLRARLSDALFELAVRLAPPVAYTSPEHAPTLPAPPSNEVEKTIPAPENELPELLYVSDPNHTKAANALRGVARDIEIGVVRGFHLSWHGGACPVHGTITMPNPGGDA